MKNLVKSWIKNDFAKSIGATKEQVKQMIDSVDIVNLDKENKCLQNKNDRNTKTL